MWALNVLSDYLWSSNCHFFKMSMLQCQYWYLSTLCKTTGYFELTGRRAKEFHKILATYRAQNRTLACVRRKSHRFSSWTVRYVNPNCHVELEIHSYFNCCCNLLFNLPPPPLNKNWTPVPWAVDFDILDIIIRYLVRLSRLWTYRKKCYKTLYIFTILALSKATSVRRALQIRLLNVMISEDFSWFTLTSNV